jgi:uncharacterized protein (TIGR02996 family)
MTESELDAFYLALAEQPGDKVTTLALADWHDERGSAETAACLRWLLEKGCVPFRYVKEESGLTVAGRAWHDGWFWWVVADRHPDGGWGYPLACRLPARLWDRLPHSFAYSPSVFKEYPTCRAAYEAVFAAWPAFRRRGG